VNKFERKSCMNATVDVAPAVRVSVGSTIHVSIHAYANVRACHFERYAHVQTIARRCSTSIALLGSNAMVSYSAGFSRRHNTAWLPELPATQCSNVSIEHVR
jgi:hypothetical protein